MEKDKRCFFPSRHHFIARERERYDTVSRNANDFRLKTSVSDTQLLNEQWLSSIIAAQGVSLKPNSDTFFKSFIIRPGSQLAVLRLLLILDKDGKVLVAF